MESEQRFSKSNNEMLKKQLKSDVNRISAAVIVNSLIMIVVVIIGMVVRPVVVALQSNSSDIMKTFDDIIEDNAFWENTMKSGIEYLLFSILGVLAVWLFMRKKAPLKRLFGKNQSMNIHSFFKCMVIFMGIQLPIVLMDMAVELGLNQFGYTAEGGMEMATSGSLTITMFLYSSLVGPIVEELIYRGFVMRSLEKYGKSFAIVVSSVFFGVMHQNFVQSVFAIIVGLVLGYVAMNYSLKWSIILHIINNCLFGDVLSKVIEGFSESAQDRIVWGIILIFFVLAVSVLIKERKQVKKEIELCLENKKYYQYAFTSVWFLLFFIASSIISLQVIEKM